MKRNVIFLDVDGVLNSVESKLKLADSNFANLKILVDWFDADIVLSSTWRKIQRDYDIINKELTEKVGVSLSGKTGVDYEHWHRGKEILNFIKDHNEIKDYIVIDDDSYDINPYIKKYHFIHTNNFVGLTEDDVKSFIKYRDEYNKRKEMHIHNNKENNK